jgi:hypothetical protein
MPNMNISVNALYTSISFTPLNGGFLHKRLTFPPTGSRDAAIVFAGFQDLCGLHCQHRRPGEREVSERRRFDFHPIRFPKQGN